MKDMNTLRRIRKLFHIRPDLASFVQEHAYRQMISQSDVINQAIEFFAKKTRKEEHGR